MGRVCGCKNGRACRCLAPPGLAGCAPCRLCRHGHSAPIPHAFAPAALRASLAPGDRRKAHPDRKSTRLNSSHLVISYAVFCLKKKKKHHSKLHTSCSAPPESTLTSTISSY